MTKQQEIYKCEICGNIVEVLHSGIGELVCCEAPMKRQDERTEDKGLEKHVPVVEKTESGIKVKVGSVAHPMEAGHYIEWIQVISDGKSYRKFLRAEDAPEAEFPVNDENLLVREYCNLHGLWIKK